MNTDPKVMAYREQRSAYLRLLALRIEQVPPELGEPEQALVVELLSKNGIRVLSTRFMGVQQLRLERVVPGCICCLEIEPIRSRQLESLNYQVFNGEQDVTVSFYCRNFETEEVALDSPR